MYWNQKYKDTIIINDMCPLCNNKSSIMISEKKQFYSALGLVNVWASEGFVGKCGICHRIFKIEDTQRVYGMLDKQGIKHDTTAKRIIRSLLLSPVAWFIGLFVIAWLIGTILSIF